MLKIGPIDHGNLLVLGRCWDSSGEFHLSGGIKMISSINLLGFSLQTCFKLFLTRQQLCFAALCVRNVKPPFTLLQSDCWHKFVFNAVFFSPLKHLRKLNLRGINLLGLIRCYPLTSPRPEAKPAFGRWLFDLQGDDRDSLTQRSKVTPEELSALLSPSGFLSVHRIGSVFSSSCS